MHADSQALDPAILAGKFMSSVDPSPAQNLLVSRKKFESQHPYLVLHVFNVHVFNIVRTMINGDLRGPRELHSASPPHSSLQLSPHGGDLNCSGRSAKSQDGFTNDRWSCDNAVRAGLWEYHWLIINDYSPPSRQRSAFYNAAWENKRT